MNLLRLGIRPRDICSREAFENAAVVVAATGGSTNAGLHLPAMAHECGIKFDLHDVAKIFKKTPYIADLKPGGKYVAFDLYNVGGIPIVIKELLDAGLLHGDVLTATGKTLAENHTRREVPREPGRRLSREELHHADRRRGRAQGQPGARRRHREGGGHASPGLHRPGTLLRQRRSRLRRRREQQVQGRRGDRHPLRRTQGRPRHARDAVDHGGALWPGRRREGGADHRRPLLRRHARLLRRPCRAGSRRSAGRSGC